MIIVNIFQTISLKFESFINIPISKRTKFAGSSSVKLVVKYVFNLKA